MIDAMADLNMIWILYWSCMALRKGLLVSGAAW